MLKTISFFIKPYKSQFAIVLAATIVVSLLESLNLAILLPLFNALLSPSDDIFQGMPTFVSSLKGLFPFRDEMLSVFVLFVGVTVTKTLTDMLREWLKASTSGRVFYDLKNRLLAKYSGLSYQSIISQRQGALIYNCTVSSKMVATFLLKLSDGFSEVFKILAILFVLAGMQPVPTAFAIGIGIVFYGLSHYLSRKVSYNIGRERVKYGTAQNVIINEFFNGIKSIIVFNAMKRWLKEFDRQNSVFTRLYIRDNVWMNAPKYMMELVTASLIFGTVVYLKLAHSAQFSSYLPVIGVFAFALVKLMPSVTNMGRIRMELLGNLPELEVVKKGITEKMPQRRQGGGSISAFEDLIKFTGVSFHYDQGAEILHDINLTIEKGKVTAVVGASGSGKSSLVNLMLCLLEPAGGQISVDGMDMKEIDIEQWNRLIGLVSQDTFIYHSTIKDNISFGDDSFSGDDIVNAAKVAYAHDFISAMPEGYETVVGERGMKLSGGQQQRLAIARAVLRKPEILIFDEATSALDSVSEKIVQDAIYNLSKDHTIIIIAHRLSTIRNADKIIVLDKGRVVETGVHEELMKANGDYSRLAQGSVMNRTENLEVQ